MFRIFSVIAVAILLAMPFASNALTLKKGEVLGSDGSIKSESPSKIEGIEFKNSIPAHRINCGVPTEDSISYFDGGIKFKLKDKDIGKCSTDPFPLKSYKPYSERAEIVFSRKLERNRTHRISFQMKIVQGYSIPNRHETWFQIKCGPTSKVPVMAYMQNGTYPFQFSLAAGTENSKFIDKTNPVLLKKSVWQPVEIVFKNAEESEISLTVNDFSVLRQQRFKQVKDCKQVETLRIGIYRSGSEAFKNFTSEIMYKDIVIETIN